MKQNKRITLLAAMLLFALYGRSQQVIDLKGTVHSIDSSKWVLSGADIYNKNSGTVGIGTNGVANSNAALEIKATDKGFLVPRIALTSAAASAPLGAHVAGMMIYNTATAGTAPDNVVPGFYYNNGTQWVQVANPNMQDLRLVSGNNHITQDAGNGSNGTAVGTGTNNIAIGQSTLSANTTGDFNIAIGNGALSNNTLADANVAVGFNTLSNNAGAANTALGYRSLMNNTTGTYNVALGAEALQSNTTGFHNIAIGGYALYSSQGTARNIGIGHNALKENTAFDNIGIGYNALVLNTTGRYNTALGVEALAGNTTGNSNVALGYNALKNNAIGANNAAAGNLSLSSLTDGSDNTALGAASGLNLTSGSDNTLLGFRSGQDLTSGRGNTALGFRSAEGITTGSYNTILGANLTGLPASLSKNIIIADGQGNRRINVDSLGNVGLNATTQKSRLDVPGYIRLGSTDATADALSTATDRAGMIRYNSTNKSFQYHNDTAWVTAASTSGSDLTNDAWVNDNTNTQIKLGTLSNGITARPAGTEFVAKDDGKIGIGTAAPVATLHVNNGDFRLENDDNWNGYKGITYSDTKYPQLFLFKARGTKAAPLYPANQTMGVFKVANAIDNLGGAGFRVNASETQTASAHGSSLIIFTTANGTGNNVDRMIVDHNGNVGIGETAPSAKLEVNGTVEIATVETVPNDIAYKQLVWNTTTGRVEATTSGLEGNLQKTAANVAIGGSTSIVTLSSGAAYEVKIYAETGCSGTFYNKFVVTGGNLNSNWVLNYLGGMSQNGAPTPSVTNKTTIAMTNPYQGGCGGDNNTSFNYTLSVGGNSGVLTITNNGNVARTYRVIIEKIFE